MAITINDLTVNFDHLNREAIMDNWQWLIGSTKHVILLTAIGDAFLQDSSDNTIHFLDTVAGKMQNITETADDLMGLFTEKEFVVNYFGVELFADLQAEGIKLSAGQIYSYKHPPVLGGEIALDNVEPTDIDVHFTLMGQLHQQIRELPEGTPISTVTIQK